MTVFLLFASLTALGLACYALQIIAVRNYTGKGSPAGRSVVEALPAVSILKPLRGLDDNLFDNLASFCRLDYPRYELIFALQDRNDPAHKVALKVKEKHPEMDITILVRRCREGLNPKVNNLIPAYRASKYGHVLISDSNVLVESTYLRDIVGHMKDPEVGLVTNLIRGVGGRTLSAVFENLHLNSFIVGSVCFLDRFLGIPCVVGKSMLMRKSDLEAIGGLESVKDHLAEDFIIGKRMHESGKKVAISGHLINNVNEYWGARKFLNRHTRWGKLRWRIGGLRYISELAGNFVLMSCLPAVLAPSALSVCFAMLAAMAKVAGDYYLGRKTGSGLSPSLYFLSPLKDLAIGLVWFVPLVSGTVSWRGNKYLIGRDSLLMPYEGAGLRAWGLRLVSSLRERFA